MLDPHILLSGPRGRRMLLQYVLESERQTLTDNYEESLWWAVANAAWHRDPGRGVSRVMFGTEGGNLQPPLVTPETIAARLTGAHLADVTPALLHQCLADAVDFARYWQEPDGEDNLLASPHVRAALQPVAEHIAALPHTNWWCTPLDRENQWLIHWEWDDPIPPFAPESAQDWHANIVAAEERSRNSDPRSDSSGEWWSVPPITWSHTARTLGDGVPAGLRFVEDSLGWERATAQRVRVPIDARVHEISSAADWAALCRTYPLEVTNHKGADWYRTTGRIGRWLIPDWSRVFAEYDGVHLFVAAYLEAAGTAIPVDEENASIIAGWHPDATWWAPDVLQVGESVPWKREQDSRWDWRRDTPPRR